MFDSLPYVRHNLHYVRLETLVSATFGEYICVFPVDAHLMSELGNTTHRCPVGGTQRSSDSALRQPVRSAAPGWLVCAFQLQIP